VPLSASSLVGTPAPLFDALPLNTDDPAAAAFWAPVLTACAAHLLTTPARCTVEEQVQWPPVVLPQSVVPEDPHGKDSAALASSQSQVCSTSSTCIPCVATCRHVCPLPAPCLPPDGVPTSCMSWVNLFPGCMLGLRGQALQPPSGTDSLWTPATVAITPWLAWTPLPSPIAEVTVVLSVRASAPDHGTAGTSVAAADFPGSLHAAMLAAARQIQGTPEVCGFPSLAHPPPLRLPHLPLRSCRSVLSSSSVYPSQQVSSHALSSRLRVRPGVLSAQDTVIATVAVPCDAAATLLRSLWTSLQSQPVRVPATPGWVLHPVLGHVAGGAPSLADDLRSEWGEEGGGAASAPTQATPGLSQGRPSEVVRGVSNLLHARAMCLCGGPACIVGGSLCHTACSSVVFCCCALLACPCLRASLCHLLRHRWFAWEPPQWWLQPYTRLGSPPVSPTVTYG
jgi:hypothetical protein